MDRNFRSPKSVGAADAVEEARELAASRNALVKYAESGANRCVRDGGRSRLLLERRQPIEQIGQRNSRHNLEIFRVKANISKRRNDGINDSIVNKLEQFAENREAALRANGGANLLRAGELASGEILKSAG